jgi:Spy/CpxP family protein refolding chaperone
MKFWKMGSMAFVLVAAILLSAPAVYADRGGDRKDGKKKEWSEKMAADWDKLCKDLNITEDQKKQLDANKEKNREEMKAVFKEMKDKKDLMRAELEKEAIDIAKVQAINNDLKALQSKMLDNKLAGILEVRKVLSAEQFKKFSSKMHGGMGFHGGKGPGDKGDVPETPKGK